LSSKLQEYELDYLRIVAKHLSDPRVTSTGRGRVLGTVALRIAQLAAQNRKRGKTITWGSIATLLDWPKGTGLKMATHAIFGPRGYSWLKRAIARFDEQGK
jgi:hypothetical protein